MNKFLTSILITCAALIASQCASAQNTVAKTIKVGELSRTYYLHVPPKLPKDKAAALVLVFHGGGGTPAQVERATKFSELADREGFLVAYPEGVGKSWNDGRNDKNVAAQRDNIDDLGFLSALLDDVAKDFNVDTKRVFSTGMSNGAIFSQYLAANLSSRFAAIAPVSGGLPESLSDNSKPEKPVSVLILQGTDDPLVPYNGGDIAIFRQKRGRIIATDETFKKWVEHNGARKEAVLEEIADKDRNDGCRVKKLAYSKGKDGTEVVLYRLEGGGHTWPGGPEPLSESLVGKLCRDINATEIIWEFFKNHPKPEENRLGPGEYSLTLKVGDLVRRYIVHVPPGYDGKKPVPVVIMFHGGGGTANGAIRETGWEQKADKEVFLAVFPEATSPDPTKPSRFGINGQAWNDGSGGFHAGEKNIPDVAFINAMIDDLIARFAVDGRRIFATGFSNGASMTFRVGVDLSGRIAAIAPFAGSLWIKQPKLDRPVSLLYITGDADPLNPVDGGAPKMASGAAIRDAVSRVKPPAREFVNTWASALDCDAEPKRAPASPGVTTLIYDTCRENSEVRFVVIKDHGHIWPGGVNQLPQFMVGKASDKFKATDAIWEFFKLHPKL